MIRASGDGCVTKQDYLSNLQSSTGSTWMGGSFCMPDRIKAFVCLTGSKMRIYLCAFCCWAWFAQTQENGDIDVLRALWLTKHARATFNLRRPGKSTQSPNHLKTVRSKQSSEDCFWANPCQEHSMGRSRRSGVSPYEEVLSCDWQNRHMVAIGMVSALRSSDPAYRTREELVSRVSTSLRRWEHPT